MFNTLFGPLLPVARLSDDGLVLIHIHDADSLIPVGVETDVSGVEGLGGDDAGAVQLFDDGVEGGNLGVHGLHAGQVGLSVLACNAGFGLPECGSLLSPHIAKGGDRKNDIDGLHSAEVGIAVPASLGFGLLAGISVGSGGCFLLCKAVFFLDLRGNGTIPDLCLFLLSEFQKLLVLGIGSL